MDKIIINGIDNCIFNNQSGLIVNNKNVSEVDFNKIITELNEIKKTLREGSKELKAVEDLENSAKKRDIKGIRAFISSLGEQFTGGTLANLTGTYLAGLLGLL